MTNIQKRTYRALLDGASIVCAASSGYRIVDNTGSPVARIQKKTFRAIHPLLRNTKQRGIFLINKNEIRKLNGNCWVKKLYKKTLHNANYKGYVVAFEAIINKKKQNRTVIL